MAFWFGDGFDLYSAITDCGTYWDAAFGSTVTLGLISTGRFAGSRALVDAGISATPYITKVSGQNDAVHHFSLAVYQTAALTGTTTGMSIILYDGATAQCSLSFQSGGALVLAAGAFGTTLATYSGAISATNTWYQFEIEVVINSTTGSIAVRRNGNTSNDFFLGSLNTRASANNYANKIGLGTRTTINSQYMDDFLWRSDAASVAWVGDIRCYTRMPASDSSVQWTRSGSFVPVLSIAVSTTATVTSSDARYTPFTAPCTGTIGTVTLPFTVASTANLKCALFASSGSAPTTLLGTATPISAPGIGTATWTFGTPVSVTQGTQYWVGYNADTSNGTYQTSAGTPGLRCNSGSFSTYASWPASNPTPLGAVTAPCFTLNITTSANSGFVGEPQQDAAASYVYSSTSGQADLYTIGSIASTPTVIVGVTTRGYFQKSDAGTRNATVQLKSGATTVQGTSTALGAGSWTWIARNDLVDPATGAAWTATGVNNALIGPIVTA